MAKTIVDASAFSRDWFKAVIADILQNHPRVKFVFTTHERMLSEMERNGDYARLFKVLEGDKRRIVVSPDEFSRYYSEVTATVAWTSNHKLCDDGHIFALVRARNVPYVFSVDGRMAKCRGCLRGKVDRKYAAFVLVASESTYDANKHAIHG